MAEERPGDDGKPLYSNCSQRGPACIMQAGPFSSRGSKAGPGESNTKTSGYVGIPYRAQQQEPGPAYHFKGVTMRHRLYSERRGLLCILFGINCPSPPVDPEPPGPDPEPEPPAGDIRAELLYLHNQDRGARKLALNDELNQCAQAYALWMYDHNNLTHYNAGTTVGERIRQHGYDWWTCGENIAMGYPGPSSVYSGWWRSNGHRANILNQDFRECGFGEVNQWWCAVYAAARGGTGRMLAAAGVSGQIIAPGGIRYVTDPNVRAQHEGQA